VSPWRESPGRASLAVIAALALWGLALWLLPGERLVATLLGLLCLGVLAPGLAATRCRVDGAGPARRVVLAWERRRWPEIRRARLGPAGLFVSPFARPHRLDRFRGLFLPLPRRTAGSEVLLQALRAELGHHDL
jgi:hypothetical protein